MGEASRRRTGSTNGKTGGRKLSTRELCEGIIASRKNAAALVEDAELLLAAGHIPRAAALSYVACEELSKTAILFGAIARQESGLPVDWKDLHARFRSHGVKAAGFVALDAAAISWVEQGHPDRDEISLEALVSKMRDLKDVSEGFPALKNAALYTDLYDQGFRRPEEVVNAEAAANFLRIAKTQLEVTAYGFGATVDHMMERIRSPETRRLFKKLLAFGGHVPPEV